MIRMIHSLPSTRNCQLSCDSPHSLSPCLYLAHTTLSSLSSNLMAQTRDMPAN